MSIVIDYSVAKPTLSQLKASEVIAVGRYLGWDGVSGYPNTGKNITATEASMLHAADISIFLAFEYSAHAPAIGADQGAKDGRLASAQLAGLDAPATMGVYFAVDYDIPDYDPSAANTPSNAMAKLGPIGQYFAAIKAQKPTYRIGVYGGYWAVKRLFDAGLVTLGWQTVAWSGGNIDPRIALYQTTSKSPIAGSDINEIRKVDYGQWAPASAPKPPAPKPPAPSVPSTVQFEVPPGFTKMNITFEK